jgi:Na+/alanine symporter
VFNGSVPSSSIQRGNLHPACHHHPSSAVAIFIQRAIIIHHQQRAIFIHHVVLPFMVYFYFQSNQPIIFFNRESVPCCASLPCKQASS